MSAAQEPRQQLINIMYIILIAMLALNVSNEVIDAFKTLNTGIEKDAHSIQAQLAENKQILKKAVSKNKHGKVYQAQVPKIEAINNQFLQWIDELQHELKTAVAPEEEWQDNMPQRLEDQQASTQILIEGGKGEILRQKIEEAHQQYLQIFAPGNDTIFTQKDQNLFKEEILLAINEAPDDKDWATHHFNQMPLVAVITQLNKLKNDSQTTAASAIKRLKNKVTEKDIPFDQFELKVVPNATKLIKGDKFEAEIFLAASSSLSSPTISINGKNYEVNEEGKVVFTANTNNIGMKQLNAKVNFLDGFGMPQEQEMKLKYDVVSPPDFAPMVSPTKMNVFYIGVENPITAAIIGVPDQKVKVNLQGKGNLSKANGTGNYTVKVMEAGEVSVKVNATTERGENLSYTMPFRTKRIPSPIAMIGNCSGCAMQTGTFSAQQGLRTELKDFLFDVNFKVKSYKMMVKKQNSMDLITVKNNGSKFNPSVKRLIDDAKPGDTYYFEEIKVVGPDNKKRTLPAIVYRII